MSCLCPCSHTPLQPFIVAVSQKSRCFTIAPLRNSLTRQSLRAITAVQNAVRISWALDFRLMPLNKCALPRRHYHSTRTPSQDHGYIHTCTCIRTNHSYLQEEALDLTDQRFGMVMIFAAETISKSFCNIYHQTSLRACAFQKQNLMVSPSQGPRFRRGLAGASGF